MCSDKEVTIPYSVSMKNNPASIPQNKNIEGRNIIMPRKPMISSGVWNDGKMSLPVAGFEENNITENIGKIKPGTEAINRDKPIFRIFNYFFSLNNLLKLGISQKNIQNSYNVLRVL